MIPRGVVNARIQAVSGDWAHNTSPHTPPPNFQSSPPKILPIFSFSYIVIYDVWGGI